MDATQGKETPLPTDLKAVVEKCADPEDVDETIAALAKAKAKKLADFSAMTTKDLEDTIDKIPPAIKSKLRDALSPFIKQAASPPGTSLGVGGAGSDAGLIYLNVRLEEPIKMELQPQAPTFQNRTREVALMARIYLKNMTTQVRDKSTDKSTIIVSTQMWGSGKTWIGSYFLQEFQKHPHLRQQLEQEFGAETVAKLANACYVLVDFRECINSSTTLPLKDLLAAELIRHLYNLPAPCLPEDKQKLLQKLKDSWAQLTLHSIVQQFSTLYGRLLFLHFDEVDVLLTRVLPIVDPISLSAVSRLYEFWTLLDPLLSTFPVYCSGRTSLLYALGRHLYESQGITSPNSRAFCILLQPFKFRHVLKLLQALLGLQFNATTSRRLAKEIYFHTGGHPRLVTFALRYTQKFKVTAIDGIKLLEYILSEGGEMELYPMQGRPDLIPTYLKFIRRAALGIPVDLTGVTNPKEWGLAETDVEVPLLEVVKLFNLYIEEFPLTSQTSYESTSDDDEPTDNEPTESAESTPTESTESTEPTDEFMNDGDHDMSDDKNNEGDDDTEANDGGNESGEDSDSEDGNNSSVDALDDSRGILRDDSLHNLPSLPSLWRISFPPLVLDNIARKSLLESSVPLFWAAVYRVTHKVVVKSNLLEEIGKNALLLRFGELCHQGNIPLTFSQVFPFYEGSYFGEVKVSPKIVTAPGYSKSIRPFVKITSRATRLGPHHNKQVKEIKEALRSDNTFEVHPQDWKSTTIRKLIKSGVIYVPGDKSASSDYFYTQGEYETHFQVKFRAGSDNALKPKNLYEEIVKVSTALIGTNKITLVFACLVVAPAVINSAHAIPVKHDGDSVAIRFASGTELEYAEFVEESPQLSQRNAKRTRKPTPQKSPQKATNKKQTPAPEAPKKVKITRKYPVPKNMDVVILLEAGLSFYLTRQNLELLRHPKKLLTSMEALTKPSQ